MKRREILASTGLALTGVSGCLGLPDDSGEGETPEPTPTATPTETGTRSPTATPAPGVDPAELDGYIEPDRDPETVPEELVCEDEAFERRSGWIEEAELQWGNLTGDRGNAVFALRVDSLSAEPGEAVSFTLTNVSGSVQETGTIHKANFEVYTDAGWQDPRGWVDGRPKPISDVAWVWEPGERRGVTFEMTDRGIIEGDATPHENDLTTCPGLPSGRYRFATAAPEQGDVGVAFDFVE